MKVYKITSGELQQGFLDFDSHQLAQQLGGEEVEDFLFDQPLTNEPILPIWKDGVACSTLPYFKQQGVPFPDVSRWGGHTLIISEKAKSVLRDIFVETGELLPITVNDVSMFLYNCLTYAKEDKELTINEYSDGIRVGLKTLAFEPDDIAKKPIFKSKRAGTTRLFVNQNFVSIFEENNLTGIGFDSDLLAPL
jgi:hypothetical protein